MKQLLFILPLCLVIGMSGQQDLTKPQKRAFRDADFAFYQGDYAYAEETFMQLAFDAGMSSELAWRIAACQLERGLADESVEKLIDQAELHPALVGVDLMDCFVSNWEGLAQCQRLNAA